MEREHGIWQYAYNLILVDSMHLECDGFEMIVDTVCHETRHAYQHAVIDMLNWKDRNVRTAFYYNDVRQWKNERDNYIYTDMDYETYYAQSIEVDARDYAEERCRIYMEYIQEDDS